MTFREFHVLSGVGTGPVLRRNIGSERQIAMIISRRPG